MLSCEFCGLMGPVNSFSFQLDQDKGFWCEDCDAYNHFKNQTKRRFTLILEDKTIKGTTVKTPSIKFSKRLSPYRYPGGKSRLIDYLFTHLQQEKTKRLVSPFTGGGSFELAMLESGVIEELHLNDLDKGVYALWYLIKHKPSNLIERIQSIELTHQKYFDAQKIIRSDYESVPLAEAAWASLIVNRLAYSGIWKANPLGGKGGELNKLLARWNPTELVKRIEKVHSMSDRIEISQENAVQLIEEVYWDNETTIFIDPPYVAKGKDLYHCFYTEKDHHELAMLLESLYHGCNGADMVITYDDNEWLKGIYQLSDQIIIGRTYSI